MIYFIQSDLSNSIKIGFSENPDRRAQQLALPNTRILAVIEGDRAKEAELHKRFLHCRIGDSEWFRPMPELTAYMKSLQGEPSAGLLPEAIQATERQIDEIYKLIGGKTWLFLG